MGAGPVLPFNSWKTLKCFIAGGHRYFKSNRNMALKILLGQDFPDYYLHTYPVDVCTKCQFVGDDYGPG